LNASSCRRLGAFSVVSIGALFYLAPSPRVVH
jgi:hypothetical protein